MAGAADLAAAERDLIRSLAGTERTADLDEVARGRHRHEALAEQAAAAATLEGDPAMEGEHELGRWSVEEAGAAVDGGRQLRHEPSEAIARFPRPGAP